MKTIEYKGKEYPIFTINMGDVCDTNSCETWVSEVRLWEAIENDFNDEVEEAVEIDNSIVYYLPDGFLKEGTTYEEVIEYVKQNMI